MGTIIKRLKEKKINISADERFALVSPIMPNGHIEYMRTLFLTKPELLQLIGELRELANKMKE